MYFIFILKQSEEGKRMRKKYGKSFKSAFIHKKCFGDSRSYDANAVSNSQFSSAFSVHLSIFHAKANTGSNMQISAKKRREYKIKNKCDLHEIAMVVASSIMYILYLGFTLLRLLLWLLNSFYLY